MTFLKTLFGPRDAATEAVITDVTRMQGDHVCIAALDGRKSIRLHDPQPREPWLTEIGGLAPGDLVTLDWKTSRRRTFPHAEDGTWLPSSFARRGRMADGELTQRLSDAAFRSVEQAFGRPSRYSENGNAAFAPGSSRRSLASVLATSVRVYPHDDGVRVDFKDSAREWTMAPVVDLAVRTHKTHCRECASGIGRLLSVEFDSDLALLRVGLTRPFQDGDHPPACYLQVNHIFPIPSRAKHFV